MGKLTISMAIFNSYVKLPEGNCENQDYNHQAGEFPYLRTIRPDSAQSGVRNMEVWTSRQILAGDFFHQSLWLVGGPI